MVGHYQLICPGGFVRVVGQVCSVVVVPRTASNAVTHWQNMIRRLLLRVGHTIADDGSHAQIYSSEIAPLCHFARSYLRQPRLGPAGLSRSCRPARRGAEVAALPGQGVSAGKPMVCRPDVLHRAIVLHIEQHSLRNIVKS